VHVGGLKTFGRDLRGFKQYWKKVAGSRVKCKVKGKRRRKGGNLSRCDQHHLLCAKKIRLWGKNTEREEPLMSFECISPVKSASWFRRCGNGGYNAWRRAFDLAEFHLLLRETGSRVAAGGPILGMRWVRVFKKKEGTVAFANGRGWPFKIHSALEQDSNDREGSGDSKGRTPSKKK